MELAILLFISVGPALFTFWRVEGWWAWRLAQNEYKKNHPDIYNYHCWEFSNKDGIPGGFAHFCGCLLGLLAGAIWPILAAITIFKLADRKTGGLAYVPKEIRIEQQKQRIEQLERKELNSLRERWELNEQSGP